MNFRPVWLVGICCWFVDCLGSHPSLVELCYTGLYSWRDLRQHSTACFSAPDNVVRSTSSFATTGRVDREVLLLSDGGRVPAVASQVEHPWFSSNKVCVARDHDAYNQSRLHMLAALARWNTCPWFISWVKLNVHVSTRSGANSSNVHYFGRRERDSYLECRNEDDLTNQQDVNHPGSHNDTVTGHLRLNPPS